MPQIDSPCCSHWAPTGINIIPPVANLAMLFILLYSPVHIELVDALFVCGCFLEHSPTDVKEDEVYIEQVLVNVCKGCFNVCKGCFARLGPFAIVEASVPI